MEAKRSADDKLAEYDDEYANEISSRNINLTTALSSDEVTALDYMEPNLFPQFLFLASMHVIPYCTAKEIFILHDLFIRLMEKDLLKFRSDLFREILGDEANHEDIGLDILSLTFILRVIVVFDDEESSALTIDFTHVTKTFVALAEVRTLFPYLVM